jgi:hypothetical protein
MSTLSSHDGGSANNVGGERHRRPLAMGNGLYGAWSLDASARTGGSGLGTSEQGQGGVITLKASAACPSTETGRPTMAWAI